MTDSSGAVKPKPFEYTYQDKEGRATQLTEDQLAAIQAVLKKASISSADPKKLQIKQCADDTFRVHVDKKTVFLVTKSASKKVDESQASSSSAAAVSEWVGIREAFRERGFLSSVKDFFKTVVTLFYPQTLKDPGEVRRDPLQAVREDYSSLLKSLRAGNSWIPPNHTLFGRSKSLIEWGERIDQGLRSRDPQKALLDLASEWGRMIASFLEYNGYQAIPVGFLDKNGVLQPLLVRFIKNDSGLYVEVFNDTPEAGEKIHPIQRWKFSEKPTAAIITPILKTLFENLVPQKATFGDVSLSASKTFTEIYPIVEEIGKKEAGIPITAKKERCEESKTLASEGQKTPSADLRYDRILKALETSCPLMTKVESKEAISPPQSVPSRVSKWFEHLIGDKESKFSPEKKLEILLLMTIEWADRELDRISPGMSDSQKLKIYESVVTHVTHTGQKVAWAITGKEPDSAQFPESVQEILRVCSDKIKILKAKIKIQDQELSGDWAMTPQQEKFSIPLPRSVSSKPPVPEAVVPTRASAIPKDFSKTWEDHRKGLEVLLSPKSMAAHNAALAVERAEKLRRKICEVVPTFKESDLNTKEIKAIFASEDDLKSFVAAVVQYLLENTQGFRSLKNNFIKGCITNEQVGSIITHMILYPHLNPLCLQTEKDSDVNFVVSFMLIMNDPTTTVSSTEREAFETLNDLLQLRHGISREVLSRLEKTKWSDIANTAGVKDGAPKALATALGADISPLSEVFSVLEYRSDLSTPHTVCSSFCALTEQCKVLMTAARSERDLEVRKSMLQEVQDKALQIVQMMPSPGTELAFGELSLWAQLSPGDRCAAAESIHALQHFVWESQMKLGRTDPSGRIRFLLLKGQAMSFALIRADVLEQQKKCEAFLNEVSKQGVSLDSLLSMVKKNPDGSYTVRWMSLTRNTPEVWKKFLKTVPTSLSKEANEIDIDLLMLDMVTCDTDMFNVFLSQDLTSQLSGDASLEKDITALYRFFTRDYARGYKTESLAPDQLPPMRIPIHRQGENAPYHPQSDPARVTYDLLLSEWVMYTSLRDPDFSLYGENPTLGVPYFSATQDLLLRQGALSVNLTTEDRWRATIEGLTKKPLAYVYPQGHPDVAYHPKKASTYSPDELQKRIREKKPSLPVVTPREEIPSYVVEIKRCGSASRFMQYAAEDAVTEKGKGVRRIDTGIMQELYLLRQEPFGYGNKMMCTSYSPEMAVNALFFLANLNHVFQLEDPRVQQFVEETLFGPFVLQQAIIEHPEKVQKALELLARTYEKAHSENRYVVALFLHGVLRKVRSQVACVCASLQERGVFSGMLHASPNYAFMTGGVLGRISEHSAMVLKGEVEYKPGDINPVQALQPLVHAMCAVTACLETADKACASISKPSDTILEALFHEENGTPFIEKITDASMRRDAYAMVLDAYRLRGCSLTEAKFGQILRGYHLLNDQSIPGVKSERFSEVSLWVRQTVFPQIRSLLYEPPQKLLTDLVRYELAQRTPPGTILENEIHWEPMSAISLVFRATFPDGNITINLTTMDIEDSRSSRVMPKPVPIPDEWMRLPDIQKALASRYIMADVSHKAGQNTYTWTHDNQQFSLSGRPPHGTLTRTIITEKGPPPISRTYTYQPPPDSAKKSQAAALIVDNGIWHVEGEKDGYIFHHGMKNPGEHLEGAFLVHSEPDGQSEMFSVMTIDRKNIVSSSETLETESPVKAAASKNILVLLDSVDARPTEIHLKDTLVRLVRKEGQWVCMIGEKNVGVVKSPSPEIVAVIEKSFGGNWEEYVIPVQREDGVFQYVMLPYPQCRNAEGSIEASQEGLTVLPSPELVEIQPEDGGVKGSIAAKVYIVQRMLLEAEGIRNTDVSRAIYLRAEDILRSLKSERPSSSEDEIASLAYVFVQIQEGFPLSAHLLKSPSGLAMNLRLMLEVQRLQGMRRKELSGSPQQRFKAVERMTKMYEAYCVLEASSEFSVFKRQKEYASVYLLTLEEKGKLSGVGDQLLHDLSTKKGMREYFGIPGGPLEQVSVPFADRVDPDFLLSLLRVSRPMNKSIDIRKEKKALPLHTLLENFWNYVGSIERDEVAPEDLAFLFGPSILPAAQSVEEDARLARIDLQARQFLLSIAEIQKTRRNIPRWIRKGLAGVKTGISTAIPQEKLAVLGLIRGNLRTSVGTLIASVQRLHFGRGSWKDGLLGQIEDGGVSPSEVVARFGAEKQFGVALAGAGGLLETFTQKEGELQGKFKEFEERVKKIIEDRRKIDESLTKSLPNAGIEKQRCENKKATIEELQTAEREIFGIFNPISFQREGQPSLTSLGEALLAPVGIFDVFSTGMTTLISSSKRTVTEFLKCDVTAKVGLLRSAIDAAQKSAVGELETVSEKYKKLIKKQDSVKQEIEKLEKQIREMQPEIDESKMVTTGNEEEPRFLGKSKQLSEQYKLVVASYAAAKLVLADLERTDGAIAHLQQQQKDKEIQIVKAFLDAVEDAERKHFEMISPLSFDPEGPYVSVKKQMGAIKTTLESIVDDLGQVVTKGEEFIKEIQEKSRSFETEIKRLEKDKQRIFSERDEAIQTLAEEKVPQSEEEIPPIDMKSKESEIEVQKRISEIETRIAEVIAQKKTYLKEKVGNPVNDETCVREEYLERSDGSLLKIIEGLHPLHDQSQAALKGLTDALQFLEIAIQLDIHGKTYDKMLQDAVQCSYAPQPSLAFPEDQQTREVLKDVLKNPDAAISIRALLQKLGPVSAAKLGQAFLGGNPLERLKAYAPILVATAEIPRIMPDLQDISLGTKTLSQEPVGLSQIERSATAHRYMTPGQWEELRKGVSRADHTQRHAVLTTLSETLKMSQTQVAAQLELGKNCDAVQHSYEMLLDREKELKTSKPEVCLLKELERKGAFGADFFETHYGLPGWFSSNTISDLMKINANINELKKSLETGVLPQCFTTSSALLPYVLAFQKLLANELFKKTALKCTSSYEFLQTIRNFATQEHYFNDAHRGVVEGLQRAVLPKDEKSLYAHDLGQSLASLTESNPLPYTTIAKSDGLEVIEQAVADHISILEGTIFDQRKEILKKVQEIPLSQLPKEIQESRLQKGSSDRLLSAICRQHRNGAFAKRPDLDTLISSLEIDETRLQALSGPKTSSEKLKKLRDERQKLCRTYDDSKTSPEEKATAQKRIAAIDIEYAGEYKKIKFSALFAIEKLKKLRDERQKLCRTYDDSKTSDQDKAAVEKRIAAIDIQYARESERLRDSLSRCQSTDTLLQSLQSEGLESLGPHIRKIIYIQDRLGITLRKNQLEALAEMIRSPSLLKQLRMGLGKTSVLLPFALDILASEGFLPIGIVPRALFTTNFQEMDETTRLVCELAGSQFIFNRQSLPKPFSTLSLHMLSQECAAFLGALERKEYVLTTIESKASIDNKIIEIECFQEELQERIDGLREEGMEVPDDLREQYANVHKALGLLYRVKGTFELPFARLVIDEADQVARANYSVNAEMGRKKTLPKILQNTVSQIFTIIQTCPALKNLLEQIKDNNQISLDGEEVNEYIKKIGKEWLKRHQGPFPEFLNIEENKEKLCTWLAGGKWPFGAKEAYDNPAFVMELKVLRKALNSSLRACLGLKVGLSADFDPTTGAVGIPASQGVVTSTTKYSDPLMQLCLTSMVAMYKPQREEYLSSQASAVLAELEDKPPEEKEAKDQLTSLLEDQKKGPVSFSTALTGMEPWKMLLRQRFAMRVASQMLIYVSDSQIVRPVQDTLRGCHVIGLTGTATRNLSHVITEEGMSGVSKAGRETTAEVLYRLVQCSAQWLSTPVGTYSLDSKKALAECVECAAEVSPYTFLINQAGAADTYSEQEIVRALHAKSKRPIVYVDVYTGKKTVYINDAVKLLEKLSDEETTEVEKRGFYYYHTPYVRGTHFDIPTGSKGVVMLSPTVNANDRDQAIYRARELGEGHSVECRISEKQAEIIKKSKGRDAALGDVVQAHHEQTLKDEGAEDLAAYRLHIQGILTSAAGQAKKDIQLQIPISEILDIDEKTTLDHLEAQKEIFHLFESFFVQPGDSDTYLRKLDAELALGGEEPTQRHLIRLVEGQIRKADRLLQALLKLTPPARLEYKGAFDKITEARKVLLLEKENLESEEEWAKIQPQLPQTTSVMPQGQEMSEAEGEAEEQQEVKAEATAETALIAVRGSTGEKLDEINVELFQSIGVKRIIPLVALDMYPGERNYESMSPPLWSSRVVVSDFLRENLSLAASEETRQSMVRILVFQSPKDGTPKLCFLDNSEGSHYTSSRVAFSSDSNQRFLRNASLFTLVFEEDGTFSFEETGKSALMKGFADHKPEAEMLLGLLSLGISNLTDGQWGTIEAYWKFLKDVSDGAEQKAAIQKHMEERHGRSNPALLTNIASHTWNKVEVKPLTLGPASGAGEKRITDVDKAIAAVQAEFSKMKPAREREVIVAVNRLVDESIRDKVIQELLIFWKLNL